MVGILCHKCTILINRLPETKPMVMVHVFLTSPPPFANRAIALLHSMTCFCPSCCGGPAWLSTPPPPRLASCPSALPTLVAGTLLASSCLPNLWGWHPGSYSIFASFLGCKNARAVGLRVVIPPPP